MSRGHLHQKYLDGNLLPLLPRVLIFNKFLEKFPGTEAWELVGFNSVGIKKVRDQVKKYQALQVALYFCVLQIKKLLF